jgi:hypothetical protein
MAELNALLTFAGSPGTRRRLCAILAILIPVAYGHALQQEKRSFRTPDELAGRWETSDGQGGAVGMNIIITAHIDETSAVLAGQLQHEDEFDALIYQRSEPDVPPRGFNSFSNSPNGGMTWDGNRITIHLPGKDTVPTFNVDLIWHEESQEWTGLFERGSVNHRSALSLVEAAFAG